MCTFWRPGLRLPLGSGVEWISINESSPSEKAEGGYHLLPILSCDETKTKLNTFRLCTSSTIFKADKSTPKLETRLRRN